MTIQLPVLIWTIIDFVLAMLILNTFLFKPYHANMRKRAEFIEEQKTLHDQNLLAAEEAKKQAEADAV